MSEQMREEFEVWAFGQCFELKTDGASYHHRTSDAWEAWQAAREPLSSAYTAVDMATAAADGFRDGAAEAQAAILTLQGQGYTYHGGQLWKPPIGQEPRFDLIDELKAENEESAAVIDQLAKILAGVAVALKGEELPLSRHSYHDLVECVNVLKLENDLRLAENEALREEIAIDNKIIADRDRLLNMFECPEHGQCVPYAMEQVEALRNEIKELHRKIGGSATHPDKGHGHVFPRADGIRMRCGGPGMCKECSADLLRKENKG